MGIPTAALPYLNAAQAAHPSYRKSLEQLRVMDVLIGSYGGVRRGCGRGTRVRRPRLRL